MLDFRILGPLEVDRDGEPVELTGQRQRAALVLLLLEANRVVPAERLLNALWGEQPPRTAATSLRNTVSQLRKQLGPQTIETRAPGYLLRAGDDCIDVARFERGVAAARHAPPHERVRLLREALQQWRGPPLPELAYESFLQGELRRLDELHLSVQGDMIDAELEAGLSESLVPRLESLIAEHPHRERLRAQLMLALYRSGRQADSLDVYQEARQALAGDLGLEPGPALRRLHGAILRQDVELEAGTRGDGAPAGDHLEDVVEALFAARLVAVLASTADLAPQLAARFRYPPGEVIETARVTQYAATLRGHGPLHDELRTIAAGGNEPTAVHRFFASLPPLLRERGLPHQLLVTTDYDGALERAFTEAGEEVDVVSYLAAGPNRGKFCHLAPDGSARVVDVPGDYAVELSLERRTVILLVRGRTDRTPARDWESFVVTEDDHLDYLRRADVAGAVPVGLAATLRRSHFLFLGYAVGDWCLRLVLGRICTETPLAYRSWAVSPTPGPTEAELWRRTGVELVPASLEPYVEALARTIAAGVEVRGVTAVAAVVSPYRGLAPFGESELDGLLFFGRERETEVVTANLIASRLTVVYGPSGVGKSSLLRAGVARRVRELAVRRAVGRGPDLACVVFASWADDPVGALGDAITAAVAPLVSPTTPPPPAGGALADVAEHWSAVLDGDLCLVLDQLEEYFVYHPDHRGPTSLLEQLPELVTRPSLRANVLLSVREDELARLGSLKDRVPHVFANARRLDRLDRDAARAAILGPLQRWNELEAATEHVEIEPELVEAVLEQSTASGDAQRIEAPYLQLVMERLWNEEAARGSRVLRASTLAELGGAEAVVREHLDRALSVLDDDDQEAAARMFEHLVTPSGTKIAHRATDLSAFAHVDAAEGRDVLDALGRERIVRPLDDADGVARRYEIFHDVLAQAILEWGHRRDLLGERFAARRRQRRLLAVTVATLVLLAVMVAVTAYALAQRGDARAQTRHARAAALAAGALAELPNDPELSLLLAREAAELDGTREFEDVLRTALTASRARAVMPGHVQGVLAAGFSRGRVVTVDGAGTLRAFDSRTSTALDDEALGARIRGAALAADGGTLVVARRRAVEVRDLRGRRRSFSFRLRSPVRAVAVDGRGDRAAVSTLDGRVTVQTARGPVFTAQPGFVPTSLAFDESGALLAAAAGKGAVVWRLATRRPVARVKDARARITGVALAADGSLLTTAGTDSGARLWRVPGGQLTDVLLGESPLTGVTVSPDGQAVVMRSRDGTGWTFEAETGRPISVLAGHDDAVTSAAFSRDGRLLVTGSDDGTARIWDPGVAPELQLVARPAQCCAAVVTGRDEILAAAGARAILYRAGAAVARFRHGAPVTAIARSGSVVVTGGSDGRVRLWPSNTTPAQTFEVGRAVTALAATPSAVIASSRGGQVEAWSTDGSKVLSFREPVDVTALAASADGRMLATAGADGIARIHDLRTGRLVHELSGHTKPLTAVAFSPDGALLATSSVDHDVRLWRVASGRLAHLLRAHFAVVSGVAFSPDGRWLVSAGPSTAGLWRTDTGRLLTYLRGHTGRLVGAGFTAGSQDVATASVDGTLRTYVCDICGRLDALLRLADRRLAEIGRRLTAAERARYFAR